MIHRYSLSGLCVTLWVFGPLASAAVFSVDDDFVDDPFADFSSIQDAIDACQPGDEVWVHPGLYYEAIDFLGKAIEVRATQQHQATIDGTGLGRSVVTFTSGEGMDSLLEGFRIGHGSGTLIDDPIFGMVPCGGGAFIMDSDPAIRHCHFISNSCWGGGGLYNRRSSPRIEGCIFENNMSEGHGGGIYSLESSSPEIVDCDFRGNSASWGGGMTNTVDCDPTMTGCLFEENTVVNVGAGMFNRSRSNPDILNCVFRNNVQSGNPIGNGGGICNYGVGNGGGPSSPTITNCLFEGNVVTGDGGGLANAYDCHPLVTDCTFRGNMAGRNGGGLACMGNLDPWFPSNADVSDCVFEENLADGLGGGFFSRASEPIVMTSIFRFNQAGLGGGGAAFEDSPLGRMGSSTFCENQPNHIEGVYDDVGGNAFSDVCELCPADINGDGVVGVDDILAVIAAWGPCAGCPADLNQDGVVNVDDILALLALWGPCE